MDQFSVTDDGLIVRAPAKINLSLLIAGKRSNGFHEIETIMAKINLCDKLLFQEGTKPGIELICNGKYWAPQGEDNLVYRACRQLSNAAGQRVNIKVTLTKNIPAGGGLGGASSNAAAALIGLNKFAALDVTDEKIADIAARLGSDIPFFLGGPIAFCGGRGEKIEKISKKFPFRAILILPDINVSTKTVYENYSHETSLYERLHGQINDFMVEKKIDLAARLCANMLEESCFALHPELARLKFRIEELGIRPVCLSGSGSVMYVITDADEKNIVSYQSMLRDEISCKSIIIDHNRW